MAGLRLRFAGLDVMAVTLRTLAALVLRRALTQQIRVCRDDFVQPTILINSCLLV
jgi:hypothetical protein